MGLTYLLLGEGGNSYGGDWGAGGGKGGGGVHDAEKEGRGEAVGLPGECVADDLSSMLQVRLSGSAQVLGKGGLGTE